MAEAILLEFTALPGEQLHFKKMLHCTLGERSLIYACAEVLPVINTGVRCISFLSCMTHYCVSFVDVIL